MPKLERLPEPNVEQAYGIYLLQNKHRLIRRLKKIYEPSVHGHKTWSSSYLLMDYLTHNPIRRGTRVMEIGCGWGPASVFCARRFKARVTGVDMDEDVFPFLEVMAALNDVEIGTLVSKFQDIPPKTLGEHKVVIGSDICFWDNLVPTLQKVINRALKAGTRRVIITDPGRPTFYELCDKLAKKQDVTLQEWYATEPDRFVGEVLEVRPRG